MTKTDKYNYDQINKFLNQVERCLLKHNNTRRICKYKDYQTSIEKYIKLKSYKNRYFKNYDMNIIKDIGYDSVCELFTLYKTGNVDVYCGQHRNWDECFENTGYEYLNHFTAINKNTKTMELCILFLEPDTELDTSIKNFKLMCSFMKCMDIKNQHTEVTNSYINKFNTLYLSDGPNRIKIFIKNGFYDIVLGETFFINLFLNIGLISDFVGNSISINKYDYKNKPKRDESKHLKYLSGTNMFKFNYKMMACIDKCINRFNIEFLKNV